MIDRNARTRLKELILDTINSRIKLNQYLRWSHPSKDRAIGELHSSLIRLFTDGYFESKNPTPKEDIAKALLSTEAVKRILAFLRSDREYEWPLTLNSRRNFFEKLLWRMGIGLRSKEEMTKENEKYRSRGDIKVWPFIRQSDFEKAEE